MKWLKSALVGVLAALVIHLIMMAGTQTGIAPFNIPPSEAFLESLGWNVGPLAFALHFGYGALWSMILVSLFGRETDASKGIGLALALWLIMMVVYSPFIGWGLFGFGPASQLPAGHPLHLAPGPLYLTLTLAQHLVYGGMIGWLNPLWLRQELAEPEIRMHRRRAA